MKDLPNNLPPLIPLSPNDYSFIALTLEFPDGSKVPPNWTPSSLYVMFLKFTYNPDMKKMVTSSNVAHGAASYQDLVDELGIDKWEKVTVIATGSAIGLYPPDYIKPILSQATGYFISGKGHKAKRQLLHDITSDYSMTIERNAYVKPLILSKKARELFTGFADEL